MNIKKPKANPTNYLKQFSSDYSLSKVVPTNAFNRKAALTIFGNIPGNYPRQSVIFAKLQPDIQKLHITVDVSQGIHRKFSEQPFLRTVMNGYFWLNLPRCQVGHLIMKTQQPWCRSGVFIVNSEHISHLVLVFLLLTLSR